MAFSDVELAQLREAFGPYYSYDYGRRARSVFWTAYGINSSAAYTGYSNGVFCVQPKRPFKGRHLIVTTPGYMIESIIVGNREVVSNIDGNAYMREHFDRLDVNQLDFPTCDIGNLLTCRVKSHYPKLKSERGFSAVIIGLELE